MFDYKRSPKKEHRNGAATRLTGGWAKDSIASYRGLARSAIIYTRFQWVRDNGMGYKDTVTVISKLYHMSASSVERNVRSFEDFLFLLDLYEQECHICDGSALKGMVNQHGDELREQLSGYMCTLMSLADSD